MEWWGWLLVSIFVGVPALIGYALFVCLVVIIIQTRKVKY